MLLYVRIILYQMSHFCLVPVIKPMVTVCIHKEGTDTNCMKEGRKLLFRLFSYLEKGDVNMNMHAHTLIRISSANVCNTNLPIIQSGKGLLAVFAG